MQLESLRRIVQEVNTATNLHDALEVAVNMIAEAMEAEVCSVYLLDERNQRYILMASKGLNPESIGEVSLGIGEGLVGLVGKREEILNLDDASSHPQFCYLPETGEERYNAFLGVPIMYRRQVMGVLVVQHPERTKFDGTEESFLITLCAQLSGAIAHSHASGQIDLRKSSSGPSQMNFQGVSGSGGIAIGRALVLYPSADLSAVPSRQADDIAAELERLHEAVDAVKQDIIELNNKMKDTLMPEERALFDVYLKMLEKQALPGAIEDYIREGNWAQGAICEAVEAHNIQFKQMDDAYLRDRALDIRDLGRRILAKLQAADGGQREINDPCILLGEEISTTTLVELPIEHILAIVTTEGATNSHMVIVARALGIPTVVGVTDLPVTSLDDAEMIIDAHQGRIFVHPVRRLRQRYKEIQREEKQAARDLDAYVTRDTITTDGHSIQLFVNTGLMIDAVRGVQRGAQGVGLYRSEIPFMLRERFPSEEEQRQTYRQQLTHFSGKPVAMRTLDIGSDKDLPYFPIEEENSALGWRGVRISLDHPEIFSAQIRAMLKASIGLDNLHILLPMVTTVGELEDLLYLIDRDIAEVQREEDIKINPPKVGIMVEVPSVLLQIEDFAPLVDFFSVGSNDLTQYLLAVDRNNPKVSSLYNHFNPGLLRALNGLVATCTRLGKPVSICGEMAGDPAAAVLLMAMGFETLSMSASNLLKIRKTFCHIALLDAKQLLEEVLTIDSPMAIRAWAEQFLIEHQLHDMVKPGISHLASLGKLVP